MWERVSGILAMTDMKRAAKVAQIDEYLKRVEGELDATTVSIAKVEKEIEEVTKILGATQNDQLLDELWESLPNRSKKRYENDIDGYGKFLFDQTPQLRDDKKQLRDEEKQLRDKEKQLRDDRKKLEEISKKPRVSIPFEEFTTPFRVKMPDKSWVFNFVKRLEYKVVFDIVQRCIEKFSYPYAQLADTFLKYPVVDGASGSGKSRLCWEVAKFYFDSGVANFVFVDCASTKIGDEKTDRSDYEMILAKILVSHFCGSDKLCDFSLGMVLKRLVETGRKVLLIQLDEYNRNPAFCRGIIRICYELFSSEENQKNGLLLIPLLSGITYVNIRSDLLEVSSGKALPLFTSLAGMEESDGLRESFYYKLGRDHEENLDRIMATFSGFPRLYAWLYDVSYPALNRNRPVGADTAQRLYDSLKGTYDQAYPLDVWITTFSGRTKDPDHRRVSDRTKGIAMKYLRRVHTIAVSGISVSVGAHIDNSEPNEITYEDLSAVGLFTLKPVPGTSFGRGTIIIPLLVLDAYAHHTGICAPGMLSPFAYSWQKMEFVAMWTLRCFWNSFYYTGRNEITIEELRPGALHNGKWLENLPVIVVDKELPGVVSLASKFEGNISTVLRTEKDGNGATFCVSDRSIFLLKDNETGNDGGAFLKPLAILNQTKSLKLTTSSPNNKIDQGTIKKQIEKQQEAGTKFDFGVPQSNVVYDLFTNRFQSPKFEESKLPDNVFLCTANNFAQVVGPVFKDPLMLFPDIHNLSQNGQNSMCFKPGIGCLNV